MNSDTYRKISTDKYFLRLGIGSLLIVVFTFIFFVFLDPNPNLLFSFCSALNIGIFIWQLNFLHKLDLLLSPLSFGIIGVIQVVFYSWGNLGARIAGDSRHLATLGSLEYYPIASFFSTIGLIIFSITSYVLFTKYKPSNLIIYRNFIWKDWQGLMTFIVTVSIIVFMQFSFDGILGEISRILTYSYHYIFSFVIIVNISIVMKSKNGVVKFFSLLVILFVLIFVLLDRSRTTSIIFVSLLFLCWMSLKKNIVFMDLIPVVLIISMMYFFGTSLKFGAESRGPQNFSENVNVLLNSSYDSMLIVNQESLITDLGYRMSGFELPATIFMNLDHGVPTMKGKVFIDSFVQGIPSYFRPEGIFSARKAIFDHFGYRGRLYDDEEMGIPLASGIADFGILGGILIYIVMGIGYWFLWRLSQISVRMFMAFIMVAPTLFYIDLFWGSFFVSIKAGIFSWLLLLILGKLIMPVYKMPNESLSNLSMDGINLKNKIITDRA